MPEQRKLGNPALLLRLPENVGAKLAKDAKKAKTTVQAVVLGILADHYGVEVATPRRGKPKTVDPPETGHQVAAVVNRWCPDVCPITFLPFFMWIYHPELKRDVPTYGGPLDSYTIPEPVLPELKKGERVDFHTIEFRRQRYDHDEGGWLIDEIEDPGMRVISDEKLLEMEGD